MNLESCEASKLFMNVGDYPMALVAKEIVHDEVYIFLHFPTLGVEF